MTWNARWGVALAMVLVLVLAACREPVLPPDVKLNPSPKDRYEITLTLQELPDGFQGVDGLVQYDIEGVHDECMPVAQRFVGVKPKSSSTQPVVFRKQSDRVYVGSVYADRLVDEDYYGLGVCKWKLTGVIANIRLGDIHQKALIRDEKVLGQGSQVNLCPRSMAISFGCTTPIDGSQDRGDDREFVATMASKKVAP